MSVNGNNSSKVGHQDDIDHLKDVNESHYNDHHIMGGIGSICLPDISRNTP